MCLSTRLASLALSPQWQQTTLLVPTYDGFATDGPNWKESTKRNTNADLSEWHGVKVNEEVVKLRLPRNKLRGDAVMEY